jgi:hypothetical protein
VAANSERECLSQCINRQSRNDAVGHFDRSDQTRPTIHVRFGPKASERLRGIEPTRCANRRHFQNAADGRPIMGTGLNTTRTFFMPDAQPDVRASVYKKLEIAYS